MLWSAVFPFFPFPSFLSSPFLPFLPRSFLSPPFHSLLYITCLFQRTSYIGTIFIFGISFWKTKNLSAKKTSCCCQSVPQEGGGGAGARAVAKYNSHATYSEMNLYSQAIGCLTHLAPYGIVLENTQVYVEKLIWTLFRISPWLLLNFYKKKMWRFFFTS